MAIEKVTTEEKKKNNFSETIKGNEGKKIEINTDEEIDEEENIQAEFEDESIANKFASQATKVNEVEEQIPDNTPIEDIQKQVSDYEASRSGKLEYKDLKQTAEFLITLIDTALSTAFKLFARDTSVTAYSIPAPNKKLLVEQLALILAKYQSKFKVEFLFFMGLIVIYAPVAIKSFQTRKLTTPKKKVDAKLQVAETIKNIVDSETKTLKLQEQVAEEKIPEEIKKVEDTKIPFKRAKGGNRKY